MIKRKFKQYRGYECLNCETPLDVSEKYCHHCGQLNSTKKITISDFIEEFLSNFYAYDSRLRNSIISMFTKPGLLAKEFNEGKRQKYANPFRLFLSVSILLFLSMSLSNKYSQPEKTASSTSINSNKPEELSKLIINDSLANPEQEKLKKKIEKQIESRRDFHKDSIYTNQELSKNSLGFYYGLSSFRNFNLKYPNKSESEALKELGYDDNQLNRYIYSKSKLFKTNDIKSELTEYFYQKLPFLIFLSLPIITIIFWMMFYSRKINYTEHLIFSYTYFTFLFICLILYNTIDIFYSTVADFLMGFYTIILFPFYLYRSLRNFYQQNRWITILKFVILNPLFGIFLLISSLIMIFLGILLF
ncbi:DUF3667 domain-containing protein [Flavobacterium sp. J27]|uniref:DUF3667 domain-containing protein n=1 Tax=Flavobacterium sp. J27 TaxID=2060419 RepID=UPI00102FA49A|nr:DUF3667 domain-containing protein [Flavobacterium sp. J27]